MRRNNKMKTRYHLFTIITYIILLCLAFAVSPSYAKLVAYLPLDEGTGKEVNDATGNGYNGTFKGNPAWTDGVYGKALEFKGAEYVEVPDASKINPESITIETWVYFNIVSGRQDFLSRNDDYALSIGGNPKDEKIWGVITTGGDWVDVEGGTKLEAKKWYHIAMTFSSATKKASLYLDGKKDGEGNAPLGLEHRFGGSLTIGTYQDRFLNGKIDDIRIWDEALSEQQIQDSMKPAQVESAGKLSISWGRIKGSN
jgi:hypothetical protein